MISKNANPVAWSALMYELEDAKEHLESLTKEMAMDPEFDETEFRISLAHVFAHLNRAWNARNMQAELTSAQWEQFSAFPKDLEPI